MSPPLDPGPSGTGLGDSRRPRFNVLVVLVDDVGIEMLETYDSVNAWQRPPEQTLSEGLYAHMPRLREFAEHGVTFTNARAMPSCSPTRAGLYTGRYSMRTGVGVLVRPNEISNTFYEFGSDVGTSMSGLFRERREYVIAEFAEAVDYRAAVFGKWHLGLLGPDASIEQGINTNRLERGFLPNGVGYQGAGWEHFDGVGKWHHWFSIFRNPNQNPQPYTSTQKPDGTYGVPSAAATGQRVRDGGWYGREKGDTTTTLYNGPMQYADRIKVDRALAWMNNQANEPFLSFLTLNLIHTPFHDPRPAEFPVRAVYGDIIDSNPAENAAWAFQMAMLEALDSEFGRLLDGLDPQVRARTLIVFTSDNGSQSTLETARELHGRDLGTVYDQLVDMNRFKGTVYEGGVRVPLIIQGPRGLVRGAPRSSNALVDVHVDVFETCRALMQSPYRDVVPDGRRRDGISFLGPLLSPSMTIGQHLRQFGFNYRFANNGDGDDLSARAEQNLWGYIRHLAGDGTYKLISRDTGFELYRLLDAQGEPAGADPFELSPLDIEGAAQSQFNAIRTEAEALLASEFDSP